MKKTYPKWIGIIVPLGVLLLWQICSNLGLLNARILPPPTALFGVLVNIVSDGSLLHNIMVSLRRVAFGYALGASFGIILGIVMGLSGLVNHLMSPIMEVMRPIPILAWVPVLILWTGIGETSKIITIAIGSFWSVLLNTTDGVSNVDFKYKEVAEIFQKTRKDTILQVVLPAALPSIFTGLRIGIGSAWLSVIGAEMVAASSGLGYFITYNREMMKSAKMYAGVITIGIIGWMINLLIRKIESHLLRWNRVQERSK